MTEEQKIAKAQRQELVAKLLANPDKLLYKKPFTRGASSESGRGDACEEIGISSTIKVELPQYKRRTVSQDRFLREYDPMAHDVLDDENIPSICVKLQDGGYSDIVYKKISIPFQRIIKNKQTMHLAANPMQFTLIDQTPSDVQQRNFITFKQYWNLRNQDGMKYKMVDVQKTVGDVGLLYYMDYAGRIKSRILSYIDGFVLCPHNDKNGDRVLEAVYYCKDNVEYIDCYDDTYMYRFTKGENVAVDAKTGWASHTPRVHGFSEIPLVTKRGDVAWNNVQTIIECYEELYNVFNAIQKRFGWGILYVKGQFRDGAKKIAGSVILNDTSLDGSGDAKFLTPPTPQGTIDTLNLMKKSIQMGSSTTFILPEDIRMSGDVSGIAVQLTQSMDIENAEQEVIEWQNVADKMTRLFTEGLAKELINAGINENAKTEFEDLHINASFKVWQPFDEFTFNQMITTLKGAGVLSLESAIELNTMSKPDEKARIQRETEEAERKMIEQQNTATDNNQTNVGKTKEEEE